MVGFGLDLDLDLDFGLDLGLDPDLDFVLGWYLLRDYSTQQGSGMTPHFLRLKALRH